jgi:hypothetical protein
MELGPRSEKLSNVLSVVSRTSPTVFRAAAASTFRTGRKSNALDRRIVRQFRRGIDQISFGHSIQLLMGARSAGLGPAKATSGCLH